MILKNKLNNLLLQNISIYITIFLEQIRSVSAPTVAAEDDYIYIYIYIYLHVQILMLNSLLSLTCRVWLESVRVWTHRERQFSHRERQNHTHGACASVRQIGMASHILECDIIFIGIWHHIIYIAIWNHIFWNVASYLLEYGIT